MKSVYDYFQPPAEGFDHYAVKQPGERETIAYGTPEFLKSKGFVVFCSCKERLTHFTNTEPRKNYVLKMRYHGV